jgi:hypothetical protein
VFTLLLITLKLSALPMVLFALGVFYYAHKQQLINKKTTLTLFGFGLIIFVPWLITNVIHSGYLLFPVPSSNWFDVDWKMRPEIVAYEVYANLAYARAPTVDIEIARFFTFSEWWPHWIKSIDIFSAILLVGGLFFYATLIYRKLLWGYCHYLLGGIISLVHPRPYPTFCFWVFGVYHYHGCKSVSQNHVATAAL